MNIERRSLKSRFRKECTRRVKYSEAEEKKMGRKYSPRENVSGLSFKEWLKKQ